MSTTRAGRAAVAATVFLLVWPIGAAARGPGGLESRSIDRATELVPAVVAGLDFGQVQVGTPSAGQDYVYANPTAGDLVVTAGITGPNAADFAITTDGCTGVTIPAAGTCTVTVTFTPAAEYARSATLGIADGQVTPPSVPLAGVGVLPASTVAWGSVRYVGGAYTWTQGAALARGVSGSTQYLHAVVQRYDVSKEGIYYRRGTTGSSWSYGTRLNPTTEIGIRSTVAASGTYVYTAWSSFKSPTAGGTQPRVLYFRSNRTNGSGTWSTIKRLTSTTGRIDYPRLAAASSVVYLTYTDAATGSIKIQVSRDRGATWRVVTLGSTSRSNSFGKIGTPVVAAYGSTVAVAWIGSSAGSIKFRSSSNYGSTWSSTANLGSGALAGSPASIAAVGTRVAVAWTGETALSLRVRSGSSFPRRTRRRTTTWGPVRTVEPSAGSTHDYAWPWIGQVALTSTSRVGIAWEACWAGCASSDPASDYRADMLWRESADNGASWARSQVVFRCGTDSDVEYEYAYMPSVIWPSVSSRYVMAGRWYGPNQLDNVVFRAGTGTP